MKLTKNLVVLDLETTGVWVDRDKIIEIAMVKISPDGQKQTYDKKVNPGMPIPPAVTKLVGISDDDVKGAPSFEQIAQEVVDFISDCDLGGFNAARFDLPVLRREVYDAGIKFSWENVKVIDAQKVYHLNEKRDLTAAYKFYCGKDLDNAHCALADTQATLEIIEAQVNRYGDGDDSINTLDRFKYEKTADFLDGERKFRWWNGKVYMMFGKYAKKHSLQEIARMDPGYLEWILSAKFSEEAKTLVSNALKGQFPVHELKENNEP